MKRRLFSDKDGTTFPEDIREMIAEARAKFDKLIREHGHIAEDFINLLKRIEELTKEGSAADAIFDKIKLEFPNFVGTVAFEFVQDALPGIIEKIEEYWHEIKTGPAGLEPAYESYRHKTASLLLQGYLQIKNDVAITRVNSDSLVQEVYRVKQLQA